MDMLAKKMCNNLLFWYKILWKNIKKNSFHKEKYTIFLKKSYSTFIQYEIRYNIYLIIIY